MSLYNNIFDAHTHYDDKWFDDDRFELLENIHTKGVCGIVNNAVDLETAKNGLDMLAIDELGLDAVDRNMLTAMIVKFGGRPVGLDTIAAATGEDASTIEDVYEPYLLRLGFIARTPRGRVLLPAGYSHMGYAPPQDSNGQTSFI